MPLYRSFRSLVVALLMTAAATFAPRAEAADVSDWDEVVAEARGQAVYWNAWGGSDQVNDYIAWVADRVADEYGIELVHVKLADTAEAVARVLAEKSAGRSEAGSIDLIWINGENFAAMKREGLLYGPFAEQLPNFALVDVDGKPTTRLDFTVPTEGYEAPWGMAQLVFYCDSARVIDPPRSIRALADWLTAHPGRFTYPAPPDFHGTTFLKQALYGLLEDPSVLQSPPDEVAFAQVSETLFEFFDALHPTLWRGGATFPANESALRQLVDDGEIDIGFSFNPGTVSASIEQGLLPESARSFVLDGGTIGNTHFVAIPFNANAAAGAMVVANFLMSPAAQLRKQDAALWGDPTVLAMDRLAPEDRAAFENQPRGIATLSPEALGPVLPEPHPDWMSMIEEAWRGRYGS